MFHKSQSVGRIFLDIAKQVGTEGRGKEDDLVDNLLSLLKDKGKLSSWMILNDLKIVLPEFDSRTE